LRPRRSARWPPRASPWTPTTHAGVGRLRIEGTYQLTSIARAGRMIPPLGFVMGRRGTLSDLASSSDRGYVHDSKCPACHELSRTSPCSSRSYHRRRGLLAGRNAVLVPNCLVFVVSSIGRAATNEAAFVPQSWTGVYGVEGEALDALDGNPFAYEIEGLGLSNFVALLSAE